ncbi:MAG: ComF family protein [Acidimicrobiaceae bacterium]|jgi:predicted amidophosphoribosyltransferase|nr:ComF family protein [Acidimicrobiaceae bacterium]MBT5849043.1 ComF family protein [Acidimicrobiaceae bacterium]
MLVYAQYWNDEGARSAVGELVAACKDHGDSHAALDLARLMGEWAVTLTLPDDPVVTAVPPNPARPDHLAATLGAAVATALNAPLVLDLIERRFATERLRDTPVAERQAMAESAGYVVDPIAVGRNVVLIDDVMLTGTTLGHLAQLLHAAGAASITPLIAAQTRRMK